MDFRFKLYRITTALALMISGFSAFTGLSVMLYQGINTPSLLGLLLWGACFIHSVLSLYLQRSLLIPELPLKENTPGGIRIMGVIELFFSSLIVVAGLALISLPDNIIKDLKAMLPSPEEQKAITRQSVQVLGGICLFMGITLLLNAILSFRYLRQWQEKQQHIDIAEEEPEAE